MDEIQRVQNMHIVRGSHLGLRDRNNHLDRRYLRNFNAIMYRGAGLVPGSARHEMRGRGLTLLVNAMRYWGMRYRGVILGLGYFNITRYWGVRYRKVILGWGYLNAITLYRGASSAG